MRNKKIHPCKDAYKNIHSSLVPNSPKLEITQMFFSREWGNTVERPQTGTPLSNEEQKD